MKYLFVSTYYEGECVLSKKIIDQLPFSLILSMPVQFLSFKNSIIEQIEKSGRKVTLFQSNHGKEEGQILGCDTFLCKQEADAFLYVGDGRFHPTALLFSNEKNVYCYNPMVESMDILETDLFTNYHKRRKVMLAKFLMSKNIGILITTKPGQMQRKTSLELQRLLEKEGKEGFLFVDHTINKQRLEDFNFIDVWINTGCPRISQDFNCLNIADLQEIGFLLPFQKFPL